jgi:hypothetical protein
MGTINAHEMQAVLHYLDGALISLCRDDGGGFESDTTWRVRMARERLLKAAVQPVAIQMLEVA